MYLMFENHEKWYNGNLLVHNILNFLYKNHQNLSEAHRLLAKSGFQPRNILNWLLIEDVLIGLFDFSTADFHIIICQKRKGCVYKHRNSKERVENVKMNAQMQMICTFVDLLYKSCYFWAELSSEKFSKWNEPRGDS